MIALVVVGLATRGPSEPALERADVGTIASDVVDKAIEDLRSAPATSAVVYQQILPSLVQIEARRASATGDDAGGVGTGVIVNASGAILTAFHVVDGATTIRLSFVDGTRSNGQIVSADPENDIAVLWNGLRNRSCRRCSAAPARSATRRMRWGIPSASSARCRPASSRASTAPSRRRAGGRCAAHPVRRGSQPRELRRPLLNRGGQVVGIVTGLAGPSRDGYFAGIGFAVPIGAAGGAADAPPK